MERQCPRRRRRRKYTYGRAIRAVKVNLIVHVRKRWGSLSWKRLHSASLMSVSYAPAKLRVPAGFEHLLEGLAREVLREQPRDIIAFAVEHFKGKLRMREGECTIYQLSRCISHGTFEPNLLFQRAHCWTPQE